MNPYHRGSRLGAMLPLILANAMLARDNPEGQGVLPWPKGQPYDAEKQQRYAAERIEAARLKRERKAAKRVAQKL